MTFTAAQIASLIRGTIEGDATVTVSSFGKIEEAQPGQLAFLANPKYEEYLYTTGASVILLSQELRLKKPLTATLIRVADPYKAFATLLTYYQKSIAKNKQGREEPVYLSPDITLGEQVYLGAFVYAGQQVCIGHNTKIYPNVFLGDNVSIGHDTVIHPGVIIYQDCKIGNHVIIHAGTVIGSDGFGFAPNPDGSFQKIPQIGNVVVEDHVEIGANTTIDRATMGSTIIKSGAKLDNLIQIAHNVEIGQATVIAAQTGISGSTRIGKQVMIGGQAGIVGHIQIADGSKINAQSGVTKSIKQPNGSVTGTPAYEYASALRAQAVSRNLPELEKKVNELERQLQELRNARQKDPS